MTGPTPDEVLAAFLDSSGRASSAEFERLLQDHPDQVEDLRRLWDSHREGSTMPEGGFPPAPDSISFHGHQERALAPPPAGVSEGQMLGDFRLLRPIGEGGMGQVWEAEQQSLRRRVALKLVRPDRVSAKALDLFAREARAGGRLHHPGIVDIKAHGQDEGIAWIAMEFVEGAWTLRDFLDEVSRKEDLPPIYYRDVAAFVAKLADAVQAAHDAGVIHRDIKPQNILITPRDEPKVTDFGLARITDEQALSLTGDFAGTYLYMSPEQIAANRIGLDHRTDIFSLGVVLYEMLALRRPFVGDTAAQIGQQIVAKDPPELRTLRSRIPRDLAIIAGKCLEKDRDRRYGTMAELASDLRRHLANEPIVAQPPGRLRKLQLWALRNPTKSVAGAVAAAAFVAISALLAENVRARDALEKSNRELTRTVGERDDAIGSLASANGQLEEQRNEVQDLNEGLAEEIASVKRLSALRDYDELIARVDALWPPHPERIEAFDAWMAEARALVADLPLHYAKRDELRTGALERTDEELEAERRAHSDWPRLEAVVAEISARRGAWLQRRDGVPVPTLEPDWSALPEDTRALNALARPLVEPGRAVFGREAEGLALARRALELAEEALDDGLVSAAGATLSLALFSLGRDEEALEASAMSLEVAPDERRADYLARHEGLVRAIDAANSDSGRDDAAEVLAGLEAERARLAERVSEGTWRFPATEAGREARWWHANLTQLIASLEELQDPRTGLLSSAPDAVSQEHGWSVPRRVAFAERLREGLAAGGAWAGRWRRAIAAIREHADYGGMELSPQTGLVPIGPDPESGLWEFWHVATGAEPTRGEDGALLPSAEMGVVLVLLPPGRFWMGAQSRDPGGRHYHPEAYDDEGPVHQVELSAYFLSKYEMTQGQWSRFTGSNPSHFQPPHDEAPSLRHPVEQVSWVDAMRELSRMGLVLPSEAQWEYGCRAGTDTPWHFGGERDAIRGRVNIADRSATGEDWPAIGEWPEHEDGGVYHREVGAYPANAWGLHEVHGNLWEWCLDGSYDYDRKRQVDPVAPWEGAEFRIYRGGSFKWGASQARSSIRTQDLPLRASDSIGVRPARLVSD